MSWRWAAVILAGSMWIGSGAASAGSRVPATTTSKARTTAGKVSKIVKSDEQWKKTLDQDQYRILREKGTERAFTGKYWNHHGKGLYRCAGCGLELFSSDTKFDSGTGWPSFWSAFAKSHVEEHTDRSLGMARTEVLCARCGGHLGHLFDDGPRPTGMRYCINSASLSFEEKK